VCASPDSAMAEISVVGTTSQSELTKIGIERARLVSMYRKMVLIRRFEEKVEELYLKMALITGPCHLYLGMEAIASGSSEALEEGDYVLATYRGHGHAVARGAPLERLFAELMGRADGTCKGLGGSMHAATWTEKRLMLATAIVGSNIPIAAGMGLAIRRKGTGGVVTAFFGDGAVNSGAFNEGVNLAAVWRVPVIFVCENNQYAMSLPGSKGISSKSIAERAASYGIHTFVSDGNDPVSVFRATSEARRLCISGEGPCFIEARTYRMKGHGIYDRAEYRPADEVKEWLARDPVPVYEKRLIEAGAMEEGEARTIREEVERELDEAIRRARASQYLDFSSLSSLVYPGGE
jgi:TPP-dependent pyruvate/acetoin dehydrogenase alpha subunit